MLSKPLSHCLFTFSPTYSHVQSNYYQKAMYFTNPRCTFSLLALEGSSLFDITTSWERERAQLKLVYTIVSHWAQSYSSDKVMGSLVVPLPTTYWDGFVKVMPVYCSIYRLIVYCQCLVLGSFHMLEQSPSQLTFFCFVVHNMWFCLILLRWTQVIRLALRSYIWWCNDYIIDITLRSSGVIH